VSARRVAGLAALAALLAAGCAAPPPSYGTIAWAGCGDFQCARLAVPLDHADPGGEKIEISLVKRPADDPDRRIGSLVVNPGGPGGSGVGFVKDGGDRYFDEETRARFDVIGFDPRGVGESAPLKCLPDADEEPPPGPAQDRWVTGAADGCVKQAGKVLPHLSTAATARDMEVLRAALGDDKLTYHGISYGTVLGATYADLYPDRVRAMVLDGPVGLATWFADGSELARQQTAGFQAALGAFYAGCLRNARACAFGDGDPAAALDRLLARLDEDPLEVRGGAPVDREVAVAAIGGSLYDEARWFDLATALKGARDGDGSKLRDIVDRDRAAVSDDVQAAVSCADRTVRAAPVERAAREAELDRLSPVFGDAVAGADICATWPHAADPYRPGAIVGKGAPPVLVLATTGDPATPIAGGIRAAEQFESGVLMTYDGWRHGAYGQGRSRCVEDAVSRYLAEVVPPADRTACPRDTANG
jgi:pimeloyl-ACP methyl ester carboxylesterase